MRSSLMKMRDKLEVELMSSLSDNAESTVKALEDVAAVLKQRLYRLR